MKFSTLRLLVAAQPVLFTAIRASPQARDATDSCYYIPFPNVPVSQDNRTVPWGEPTIQFANGTTCCSSLDQVSNALIEYDAQILQLLGSRSAYIREAARFKAMETELGDASRRQLVVGNAINGAPAVHLPQIIAEMVYETLYNASVLFEQCVFDTYDYTG